MNKKSGIIVAAVSILLIAVGGSSYYVWKRRKKNSDKEAVSEEGSLDSNPKSPKEILDSIIRKLVEEKDYKNERDLLNKIISDFFKTSGSYEWMEVCPKDIESLIQKVSDLGLLDEFERDLEKKYKTGN